MDLIGTLQEKIDRLADGEYLPGFRSVLLHIETAFRHLSRGQSDNDDTAYTDAIYRTNQAFEGSIKESYRVLAGKDPSKKTPFEIESYLEKNEIFRTRVLKQFTNYRTEWRNPSTHNYKLDFDSSEAFLAIVSVTAFACVLLDEISARLSFLRAKAEIQEKSEEIRSRIAVPKHNLVQEITNAIQEFASHHKPIDGVHRETEFQIIGALHGFLSTALPDIKILTDAKLDEDRPFRVDMLVQQQNASVVIEVKNRYMRKNYNLDIAQVEHYMMLGNIKTGILLFFPDEPSVLSVEEHKVNGINGLLTIMRYINEN